MIGRFIPLAALLVAPWPTCASAQDVELSANAAVVSDYRFRGVSASDRKPAIQGGIDLEGEHVFVGGWASSITETSGAHVEMDLYAGLQGTVGEVAWTAAVHADVYPGGVGQDYIEFTASGERAFGDLTLGVEAALAPEQENVGEANGYLGASAAYDLGDGWALAAHAGYEDGFYDSKSDWELAARYTVGPFTVSLAYIDTDHGAEHEAGRDGKGGLIGSLSAEF